MKVHPSSLAEFKDMLANPEKEFKNKVEDDSSQIIKIRKNLILGAVADFTGCGHIRLIFPFNYLNSIYAKPGILHTAVTPFFTFQSNLLLRTKALYFQRQMSPEHVEVIKKYKENQEQFKYRMCYDIDDFIFKGDKEGEEIPEYNFGRENVDEKIVKCAIEAMNMMDLVTVSTDFLGTYLKETVKIKPPVKTIPNTVLMSFWGSYRKQPITEKIQKPKLLISSSPTHYHTVKKLRGDFENSWTEYLLKNIKDNKIDVLFMGCTVTQEGKTEAPFFMKEVEGKENYHMIGWLNSYQYHLPIIHYKPDFGVGPLVPNYFNFSKSNIKALENYACGSAFIGSIFRNGMPSPYDDNFIKLFDNCSVKDIEETVEYNCYPEHYNSVIQKQYKYLNDEGRWLESKKFVDLLCSTF
jgi:hypothetical protein